MPGLMLLGVDHRVAPFEARERLTVPKAELGDVLGQLAVSTHIREVFLLSTGHQTELYLRGQSSALDDIRRFWQERAGITGDGLEASLYQKRDEEAVYHLFTLGAGLDPAGALQSSALEQIKESLACAREAGTIGGYLDTLLVRTIRVARRLRPEMALASDPVQLEKAQEVLRQEAGRFIRWARSRRATMAITALQQRAEEIRRAELLKMEVKLRHLSPEQRQALETLTQSMVKELLQPSRKALKGAAGLRDASDYLQTAWELFDLDEP